MQVCFIGHRYINITKELIFLLRETIYELLTKGFTTFLFGSMSEFDNFAWEVVTNFKSEYPNIKRVYVRSAYQNITKSYEQYLLKRYEETYFSSKLENAGKYAYVERNFEMIDKSACCIFYYNENYIPQTKSKSVQRKSGTKIAYEYAQKKKKFIVNVYR